MTKKSEKQTKIPNTIKNFWLHDIDAMSIDMTKVHDEDEEIDIYYAHVTLHLKTDEDGNTIEAITLPTCIASPDPNQTLKETIVLAQTLFGADMYSNVIIFDEDGEIIEEVDLNKCLDDNMPVDKKFDLKDMEAGIPLIAH